jgi:Protein of unknown function (DUF4012)
VFRRIVLPLGLILVIVAIATAFILISARRSLQSGVSELRLAQDNIRLVQAYSSLPTVLRGVRSHVDRAQADFTLADDRLALVAPLVEHLGWVPSVGSEVAIAPYLAHAARQTTDGALSLVDGLTPLARRWTTSHGRVPALVAGLSLGGRDFTRACRQFDDAAASRRTIPGGPYPATVTVALRALDDRLPALRILCRTLVLAPALLGNGQPTSYLVVYQNSAELRATGGFIGSASVLTVHRGVASQLFEGVSVLDNLSVPPPEPVAYYNGEPGWLFRDSNWSPDFPTSAALERFFYRLDFHRDVPNVIDVTPQAAADILAATGPVYVSEYRRMVNGANVAALADYYAHWATNPGRALSGPSDTHRKQFIGLVARQVVQRIGSLTPKSLIALGQAVGTAVEHGDVLLNFRNPRLQSLVQGAGASHAVTPGRGDYLFVVDTNLSYNKINPYVHMQSAYTVRVRADRWLDAQLTIHLHNVPAPPAIAQFGFGPGAGKLGGPDDYATFLRIYVPPGAALIDQSGWTQPWLQGPAYGGTMFSGYLLVPRGATRTVRLHYIVPPNVFLPSRGQRYTLLLPHQPGSSPDEVRIRVIHDGITRSWLITRPTLDWRVTLPISSRPFHPIPLAYVPPPATNPGGWVEPHAFLAAPNGHG